MASTRNGGARFRLPRQRSQGTGLRGSLGLAFFKGFTLGLGMRPRWGREKSDNFKSGRDRFGFGVGDGPRLQMTLDKANGLACV